MKEYRNQVNKDFPNQGFESGDQKDARELEFQSWKKEYMLKLRRNELRWKREVARFQRDREARQRAREQKEAEQAEESEDHPIGEAEVDDESGMQDVPDDHRMDEEVPGTMRSLQEAALWCQKHSFRPNHYFYRRTTRNRPMSFLK
jgi:hypothetical protein